MSYIFDTNMLMTDVDINKYKNETVYVPIIVLEELDKHNHSYDKEKAYLSRKGIRSLQKMKELGIVKYVVNYDKIETYSSLDFEINDNKILLYAIDIQRLDKSAILYTRDLNMYEKAIALGISSKFVTVKESDIYKGYIEVVGDTKGINDFFENLKPESLYINQYVLIKDTSTGEENELRWDGTSFVGLKLPQSKIVKAKNALQRCALDLMMNKDITAAAILGGYGSGKTFLCMQMALHFVMDKKEQNKILGIREPNGEGKDIGYLKGTFEDKTAMFFKPVEQQLKDNAYDYLISNGTIETIIPYYMKGTTYDDTIMLVDEAEDLSEQQLRLIGTRIGSKSRVFFAGDFAQSITNKTYTNPLVKMCEELKGNKMFGCIYLDEDVRSETSKMFANLFKK